MSVVALNSHILQPDDETCLLFLSVPGSKVVLFQGFFELYEGLATVRTIDIRRSEIMLITTPTSLSAVELVLSAIKEHIDWSYLAVPDNFNVENFFHN